MLLPQRAVKRRKASSMLLLQQQRGSLCMPIMEATPTSMLRWLQPILKATPKSMLPWLQPILKASPKSMLPWLQPILEARKGMHRLHLSQHITGGGGGGGDGGCKQWCQNTDNNDVNEIRNTYIPKELVIDPISLFCKNVNYCRFFIKQLILQFDLKTFNPDSHAVVYTVNESIF